MALGNAVKENGGSWSAERAQGSYTLSTGKWSLACNPYRITPKPFSTSLWDRKDPRVPFPNFSYVADS